MVWDARAIMRRIRQEERVGETEPRETEFVWATCWLFRHSLVEEFGLFDERFFMYDEDIDFCYRMKRNGVRMSYYPGASLEHIGGASGTATSRYKALLRESFAAFTIGSISVGRRISHIDDAGSGETAHRRGQPANEERMLHRSCTGGTIETCLTCGRVASL